MGLTTIAVAVVARADPHAWAPAIALGAIVAPPDAAAATAVLRQLKPPQRILTVLEGESLLNDASALLIYRLAVGAVAAGGFSIGAVAPAFLLAVVGSVVVGPSLGWLVMRLSDRVRDVPTAIILQFVSTFGVWILADRIGLSGVLTMVCFAITAARTAPERIPARIRIPSYAVWETVIFVLNVLAFVFIGLQIRPILASLDPAARGSYAAVAAAVLVTVIVVRIAWHMSFNAVIRWRDRRVGFHPPRPMLRPTVGSGLVISWSGMRGIVTLAAALALPADFPFRDLVVLTAFSVVLGTLVIQGLTLKPLLLALDLRDDDPVGHEVGIARERALGAALAELEGRSIAAPAEVVRQEFIGHLGASAATYQEGKPLTTTFTAGPSPRRAAPFSRCARATRSATLRFTTWKRSWTGSKCPTVWKMRPGAKANLLRHTTGETSSTARADGSSPRSQRLFVPWCLSGKAVGACVKPALVNLLGFGDDRFRRRDAGRDHHFAHRSLGFR